LNYDPENKLNFFTDIYLNNQWIKLTDEFLKNMNSSATKQLLIMYFLSFVDVDLCIGSQGLECWDGTKRDVIEQLSSEVFESGGGIYDTIEENTRYDEIEVTGKKFEHFLITETFEQKEIEEINEADESIQKKGLGDIELFEISDKIYQKKLDDVPSGIYRHEIYFFILYLNDKYDKYLKQQINK
jgi:hypothetical protein